MAPKTGNSNVTGASKLCVERALASGRRFALSPPVPRWTPLLPTPLLLACLCLGLVACGQEPPAEPPPPAPAAAGVAPLSTLAPSAIVLQRVADLELASLEADLQLERLGQEVQGQEVQGQGEGGARYQGPAPAEIAESTRPVDQSDPARLVSGALEAMARGDLAALARLSRTPAERPRLTDDDAADARRRYLAPAMAPTWSRVAAAIDAGRFEVVASEPAQVVVVVQVGGALGTYRISLRKDGDSWFMVG